MPENTNSRVPKSFWIIGALSLIWNLMSVMNFFMQMNAEALASMTEAQRAIIVGRPSWATAAFALAVFGGAGGSILLLLRKRVAYYLFIASLVGVVIQLLPYFSMSGSFESFEILMYILLPLAVAVFLTGYTKKAQK